MSRVDEIRARLEAAMKGPWEQAVRAPNNCPIIGAKHVMIAMLTTGIDFIAATPEDISYLLARVEKLEGLLTRICASLDDGESGLHGSLHIDYDQLCTLESEARTLLADESNRHD